MDASTLQVFDIFLGQLGKEGHNLPSDTIKLALFTSSYTPNSASDVSYSALSNEVANGDGYTTGGETVSSISWDASAGVLNFDSDSVVWTASGSGITARTAVMYNASAGGSNDLIGYITLDTTPADVSADDGEDLTVAPHADGWFDLEQTT